MFVKLSSVLLVCHRLCFSTEIYRQFPSAGVVEKTRSNFVLLLWYGTVYLRRAGW